jgi:hypothetical protein
VAAFAGLVWNGLVIEAKLALSETGVAQAVAELKAKLPPGAHLVSFGPTHHLFAYYYRDSIAQLPWPDPPAPGGPEPPWEYFCYATRFSECPPLEQLPYPYEQLAVISCERQRTERPERVVIVARRVAAE